MIIDYKVLYSNYVNEREIFINMGVGTVTGMNIYHLVKEYLRWYRGITKLKINPIKKNKYSSRDQFNNDEGNELGCSKIKFVIILNAMILLVISITYISRYMT